MYYPWLVLLLSSLLLPTIVSAQDAVQQNSQRQLKTAGSTETAPLETIQWAPLDIELEATSSYDWWEFPVTATFQHVASGQHLTLEAFFDGDKRYIVRFAPPAAGAWTYETTSRDSGLANRSGKIEVIEPSSSEIAANPNLRGHLQAAPNGRYFQHADGTPFLLLADTNWSINTQRCGLGENSDGPFYTYLDDRKSKGYTMILMSYMRGFGDTREPAGQRNEGGYPFPDADLQRLIADYFDSLDQRMNALWQHGMAVGTQPTWFGKMNCFFDHESAVRISSYLAVRYGAYNGLWSLSGEYQYAMNDCQWTEEQINQLGNAVAAHNPYQHLLSIHPSGRTDWPSPHDRQSSIAFHSSGWLDHHWLQTGQKQPDILRIAPRLAEVRALHPTRPALQAESFYERASDKEHAYHTRWQCWTAMLSGAAGYGYGAFGVWNFYDPQDPNGETGKKTEATVPWPQALNLEGSGELRAMRELFITLPWWELTPTRCTINAAGIASSKSTVSMTVAITSVAECSANDMTIPHAAHTADGDWIVYLPRSTSKRTVVLDVADNIDSTKPVEAYWFDPRSAARIDVDVKQFDEGWDAVPEPPTDDDWGFVLDRGGLRSPKQLGQPSIRTNYFSSE